MRCAGSVKASFILWPAMRTAREAGRFVYSLLTTWLSTGLARRRRALCFMTIRSRHSRGESCPTFRKWQTRPGIHEPQEFAHDVESIAGGAPPVPGIEGIGGSGTHDGASPARGKPVPEQTNAARMSFCRDKYHGGVVSRLECSRGGSNLVGRIYHRWVENVNRFRGHAFVNQKQLVVAVLAEEGNTHFFQSFAGLRGMGQPDFRRVSFAVQLRCFDRAQRHRSAQHHDRLSLRKRILHYQPAAQAKENHRSEDQADATADEKQT